MNAEFRIQNSDSNDFSRLQHNGYQIIKALVGNDDCNHLITDLTPLFEQQIKSAKSRIGGVRNLMRTNPLVVSFAKNPALTGLLQRAAGKKLFPVRAIFFDKNPDANWLVPWHQDLAIAVAEKIASPGFTGWSMKDDVLHVHPPVEILATMITLRLHLDDCDASNGALKVIAGSHSAGKIPTGKITGWTASHQPVTCEVSKGDAMLMRPLLLHASAAADNPGHRRVLHIEYAAQALPDGLKWFDN